MTTATITKIPLPTPEQLAWSELERGVIIHLDVQVFEPDYEFREKWGYTPSPAVFNPSNLDTDQWVAAAKSCGANYVVLVAKHCSGFSLWPTKAHDYSVKSSPWKNGQGDVVGDFFKSCKKYGVKPGLYCSGAANAYLNVDSPGTVRSGDPEAQKHYNWVLETQLTELWSNYGEVNYIWFDGGVLPPEQGGPTIIPLMKKLQPHAVVYQGPEEWPSLTRFTGNERGEAPDPFWNTTSNLTHDDGTIESNDKGGGPGGKRWVCGESDLPNRCQARAFQAGWFWRKDEEQFLYSLDHLVERYFTSIARNTNLLIGMVIDPEGRVPEPDEKRFAEFGERIAKILSNRVASTSGKGDTVSLALPKDSKPNMLMLMEHTAQGERVHKFIVEGLIDGAWVKVWQGSCIGRKKIERFDPINASELRLKVIESAGEASIREFSAWKIDEGLISVPMDMTKRCQISIQRGSDEQVKMTCSSSSVSLRYTFDGSEPGLDSPVYVKPFSLPNGGTVKAQAFVNHLSHGPTVTAVFGVSRKSWRVVRVSLESPYPNGGTAAVTHLLTDDPKTYWHTFHTDKGLSAAPHEVVLDMGRAMDVEAFTLLPRDGGTCEGTPDQYAFYLSRDGEKWNLATEGELTGLHKDYGMRLIPLAKPMNGRYLRFIAKHIVDNIDYVVVAGLGAVEAAK